MAESAGNGVSLEKPSHGSIFDREELDEQGIACLDQVGNLTYSLIKATTPEQRRRLLNGSEYIVGVASSGPTENPDYLVWVRKGEYEVMVKDYPHPSREIYISILGGTGPIVQTQVRSPEDVQGFLGATQNARANAAIGDQDWLN